MAAFRARTVARWLDVAWADRACYNVWVHEQIVKWGTSRSCKPSALGGRVGATTKREENSVMTITVVLLYITSKECWESRRGHDMTSACQQITVDRCGSLRNAHVVANS